MKFPILGLLGLMFIGLKLAGIIAWSWIWVLAPFWIPLAFVLFVFAVGAAAFSLGVRRR